MLGNNDYCNEWLVTTVSIVVVQTSVIENVLDAAFFNFNFHHHLHTVCMDDTYYTVICRFLTPDQSNIW